MNLPTVIQRRVVNLYFSEKMTNVQISEKVGIHDSQVSRIIRRAVQEGWVIVNPLLNEDRTLARELLAKLTVYGIRNVHVEAITEDSNLNPVHRQAARLIEELVTSDAALGVTCGTAVLKTFVCIEIPDTKFTGLSFIPFNSYFHDSDAQPIMATIDSTPIALLARLKFGMRPDHNSYNYPPVDMKLYSNEPQQLPHSVKEINRLAAAAKLVVCGIGTVKDEPAPNVKTLLDKCSLTESDINNLGWAGEINLQPFLNNGKPFIDLQRFYRDGEPLVKIITEAVPNDDQLRDRVLNYYESFGAVPLNVFKSIAVDNGRKVLAVVYGAHKAEAVYAACKGKLVQELVLDEDLAIELKQLCSGTK